MGVTTSSRALRRAIPAVLPLVLVFQLLALLPASPAAASPMLVSNGDFEQNFPDWNLSGIAAGGWTTQGDCWSPLGNTTFIDLPGSHSVRLVSANGDTSSHSSVKSQNTFTASDAVVFKALSGTDGNDPNPSTFTVSLLDGNDVT